MKYQQVQLDSVYAKLERNFRIFSGYSTPNSVAEPDSLSGEVCRGVKLRVFTTFRDILNI